jgi:acyl-CoA reductase-like NAD-dependent aldehyde dehydrogenase
MVGIDEGIIATGVAPFGGVEQSGLGRLASLNRPPWGVRRNQ